MTYDFLIVGAGLYGAVFAHQATKKGKRCLVIDKRAHLGGNIYTENKDGINVHCYGAHIFHTENKRVWDYINSFAEFNNYVNSPVAVYNEELYNLPFNMNTFSKMWGIKTPDEAKSIIEKQRLESGITQPKNLEEQAIFLAGRDIYEKLIKDYTEKQWGRSCKDLPASIIKRIPLRFVFDNNYFTDRYQGIPIGGYTQIIEKMLTGCDIRLETDYFDLNEKMAEKVVYTGQLDRFFNYSLGKLEYRSLRFETETLNTGNFQGNAVVNYTSKAVPFTRIIEHKHFEKVETNTINTTIITREYPENYSDETEPYYPINDEKNNSLRDKYIEMADNSPDVIFGGRLGLYRYYDMDDIIIRALSDAQKYIY